MKIYLDVDNVVLNSIKASVSILNDIYGNNVDYHDVHKWDYKDVFPNLSQEAILESFGSPEFFERVEINYWCKQFILNRLSYGDDIVFFTKGTPESIQRKAEYLEAQMPFFSDKCKFIGIPINDSKGKIDLSGCCLIDDNQLNLIESNADIKILFMQDSQKGDWNDGWEGLYCKDFKMLDSLFTVYIDSIDNYDAKRLLNFDNIDD